MTKQFILTIEGVNKTFDGFKAISDLNFYMDEGGCVSSSAPTAQA